MCLCVVRAPWNLVALSVVGLLFWKVMAISVSAAWASWQENEEVTSSLPEGWEVTVPCAYVSPA